jgi:ParB family transcriptional regulator, chromosome partitioning protein
MSSAGKISLTPFDDIFKTDEERKDDSKEKVQEIHLSELFPFKGHPFQVLENEDMQKLVDSVRENGVVMPALARPRAEGGYELIAGHRRQRASQLAGLQTMPVIIREMDDDTATIFMVDSNLQRETLLPSERAYAYKMKLEAMKRQGQRTDLTCSQVGNKLQGKKSSDILAEQTGESKNQIFRYIRLTELIPPLLQMVDDKKLSFNPAVELSYLQKEEQSLLLNFIEREETNPSLSQAQRMKKYSQNRTLDANVIDAIMTEDKAEPVKITLTGSKLKQYFPKGYTQTQMEDIITKLLDDWKRTTATDS